jgi:hypothetical protein
MVSAMYIWYSKPKAMDKAKLLNEVLMQKGYRQSTRTAKGMELDEVGIEIEDMNDEAIESLARLGWVAWFDAEGGFHSNNSHSEIVRYALAGVGIDANVTDKWQRKPDAEDGEEEDAYFINMEITINGKKENIEAYPEFRSDYCDNELIVDAIKEGIKMGGLNYECLVRESDDQLLCILTVPEDVAALIKNLNIIPLDKNY